MLLSPFLYLVLVVPGRYRKIMSCSEGKWFKLGNGSAKISPEGLQLS